MKLCKELNEFIEEHQIKHFEASELFFLGSSNSNPNSRAYGLNHIPAQKLWDNIVPTVKLVDRLREELNLPIRLLSIYRSPEYNRAIGGARHSRHLKFDAIDFVVLSSMKPKEYADILKTWRSAGDFKGGIGVYRAFVHLDTRGQNKTW